MRAIVIFAAASLIGCSQNVDSAAANEEDRAPTNAAGTQQDARAEQAADPGSVLASLVADTVRLVHSHDGNKLVWTTSIDDTTLTRWTSRTMYSGVPSVELVLVDGDEIPDLFWTLRFEEIIGGMLVVGTPTGAREAFLTDRSICSEPSLQDVNEDGLLDIVEYNTGALTRDECRGDALAMPCQQTYATDWAVAHIQIESGFTNDPSHATQFYLSRSEQYSRSAQQIRQALEDRAAVSPRCDAAMALALDSMAVRAGQLVRGG